MSIEVKGVSKTFDTFKALDRVDLNIETGELLALLGPSGSGKTTLLRIIAGLEVADEGQILFHGEDTKERKVKDRQVGFVFQHYALFRHMTVFENIAFGLRVKPKHLRLSDAQIKEKVHGLLRLIQLDYIGERYPWQLSGGQRQRIALARALAVEPKVLLLDEPFGSLDAQVRKELRQWLRRFHDQLHITSLFVTHDQEEALEVADKIVVMNKGRLEQVGTPEEVYHKPANKFVLNFLGNVNFFHARVVDGKAYLGNAMIDLPDLHKNSKTASLFVRPHQFELTRQPKDGSSLKAVALTINPAGSVVKIDLKSEGGDTFQAEITQEEFQALRFQKGDTIYVSLRQVTYYEYEI
ncbi:MAG TPA: sulfate ABC transporter ATP-binding protein [Candidatus Omnitrophica bacterium]|nr:MAG: sulfate ABC transporter ATP-binding protein [Omnitrophica WOR_2 bacterium GWA2_45_18]OGX19525.1 MAG: sulfate ABC transporter ATP-binding protein [Omnitrophica WOR_2 bacterium GWC2_45_7]HBR14147.1 sulfate ABC transporter ATP-binding protein [Candidatus Omnitrophota bacterium]